MPIENAEALELFFNKNHIDYCINCAAYTAVDKAESEKEKAFLINAEAVGDLGKYLQIASGKIHSYFY